MPKAYEAALRVSLPTTKDVLKELVEVDVKGTMRPSSRYHGLTLSAGWIHEDGGFRRDRALATGCQRMAPVF